MDALDPANVDKDREKWELVVRKVRAGQMPPLGMKRPEPAEFESHRRLVRERARPDRQALHPAAGTASFESYRIRERRPRSARPRYRRVEVSAVGRLDFGVRQHRRRSRHLVHAGRSLCRRPRRRSAASRWDIPRSRRSSSIARVKTRRRTITSRGCRSAPVVDMLVPHTFPSDGEYTLTVTPIFGDNMSPTGFGSVPCERIEMLLDGKRLAIQNWQGGGRNTPTNCSGRPGAAATGGTQQARRHRRRPPPPGSGSGAICRRCAFASRRLPAPTWWERRSPQPTSPRASISTSTSRDRPCRRARRLATPSSRTSARSGSKGPLRRRRRRTHRAGARSSSARRRRRPKRRRARAASSPTSPRMASAGRRQRRTSTC